MDAELAATLISDVRLRLFEHVQNLRGLFCAHQARRDSLALLDRSVAFEGSIKSFCQQRGAAFFE